MRSFDYSTERIAELVLSKKLEGKTQQQVESEIGLAGGTLSKIINGQTKSVYADTIMKIADYFNVSTEYLFESDNDKSANPLPRNLPRIRQKKGLTHQEMADALGVARQTYTNYENGSREPNLSTVVSIAKILDTTPDYLLGFREDTGNDFTLLDICKHTGLSEESIKYLQQIKNRDMLIKLIPTLIASLKNITEISSAIDNLI